MKQNHPLWFHDLDQWSLQGTSTDRLHPLLSDLLREELLDAWRKAEENHNEILYSLGPSCACIRLLAVNLGE